MISLLPFNKANVLPVPISRRLNAPTSPLEALYPPLNSFWLKVFWPSSAILSKSSSPLSIPNASISSDVKIGRHCIVNLNSSVGHDSKIDHNVLILPGANISGNCTIHEKTLVGSNAFIYQGITVGKNNSIDALTYIGKDLDDDMISISATTKSLKKMTP